MKEFKRTGFALRNQNCDMGGRIYNFVQGESYDIFEEGDWAKFVGKEAVLRPDGRYSEPKKARKPKPKKVIEEVPEPKPEDYNEKTDKLRSGE